RHDTFTPFWLNGIENAVNIALAFPLYAWLGIPGLALAFSLSYLVAAVLTLATIQRRVHGIDGRRLALTFGRVLAAGGVVAAATWPCAHVIGWSGTLHA